MVVWVDLLPNRSVGFEICDVFGLWTNMSSSFFLLAGRALARQCEFGMAILRRLLETPNRKPHVRYFGCLRDDQEDVVKTMEGLVYESWDNSDAAPPKSRPTEELPDPTLQLLSWNGQAATFPESLVQKWVAGSAAHAEMVKLNEELIQTFPESANARPGALRRGASRRGQRPRAVGKPDFSVDGGAEPLDFTRMVDPQIVGSGDFNVERRAAFDLPCHPYLWLPFL